MDAGELSRDAAYQDLFPTAQSAREVGPRWCARGTAGWEGEASVEDLGTAQNDGRTFIRVTLYAGKLMGDPIKPGLAQGRKIVAELLGPFFAIPPAGVGVVVFFPDGDDETPGNGVVHGCSWSQKSPTQQFKSSRAVLDVGAGMDLVVKGRSVTVADHGADNPGQFGCWLVVGPVAGGTPTISCNDPTGSGWTVGNGVVGMFATDGGSPPNAECFLQLKKDSMGLGINGSGLIKLDGSGKLTVGCSSSLSLVGGNVCVGAAATPATPAIYGPAGPAGVASTCVFISP